MDIIPPGFPRETMHRIWSLVLFYTFWCGSHSIQFFLQVSRTCNTYIIHIHTIIMLTVCTHTHVYQTCRKRLSKKRPTPKCLNDNQRSNASSRSPDIPGGMTSIMHCQQRGKEAIFRMQKYCAITVPVLQYSQLVSCCLACGWPSCAWSNHSSDSTHSDQGVIITKSTWQCYSWFFFPSCNTMLMNIFVTVPQTYTHDWCCQ